MNLINDKKNDLEVTPAISTLLDYSYIQLYNNIKNYLKIFKEYKEAGIDRVGIIIGDGFNFNTICLIHALVNASITPVIMDEKLNDNILGILNNEDIKIVFYESLIKPNYLKGFDIEVIQQGKYYVTAKPYVNVGNTHKMQSLSWYLKYLNSKKYIQPCIASLYKSNFGKVEKEVITSYDLECFNNNLSDITSLEVVTSFPLYEKEGFMILTSALFNDKHLNCFKKGDSNRMVNRILKVKPEILTLDIFTFLTFLENDKYKNSDLSFVKKIFIDSILKDNDNVYNFLDRHDFKGEIINISKTEKIK